MPYKSDKMKLSDRQDRRRKLTDEQHKEIKHLHEQGMSLRGIAKIYHVDKKTISLIVNPEAKAKQRKHNQETWRLYQKHGEEWAEVMREHRIYKHKLYLEGKLG